MSIASSLRMRRKLLVLASLFRISDSLCCTSGWSITWTLLFGMRCRSVLENRSVAGDLQGRQAAAVLLRQLPAGGPGAAFEHARQRQPLGVEVQQLAHFHRQFVEQGHGEGTPFDDQLVTG